MFSPLEQFDVIRLLNLSFLLHDISINNIILPFVLINLFVLVLIIFLKNNSFLIPSTLQLNLENLFNFILNIILQQIGKEGVIYFPYLFTCFSFILFSNLISLVPFGIAITSHIILIIYISIVSILSIFVIGIKTHKIKFFRIFIPECPFFLLFILIPIEIFSYFIRMFSLSIRLAANILAGHTLLNIISAFILNMFLINPLFILIFIFPLLAILLLELGVAFLQAFVFTILLSIYLSDSLKEISH